MNLKVDASEVRELAVDLRDAPAEQIPEIKKVVARGALNIKRDMRDDAKSNSYYQHFHRSITYDKEDGGLAAEIGPDKDKQQGALGNILYFGTSKNGPELSIHGPLEAETPRFRRALGGVLGRVLE